MALNGLSPWIVIPVAALGAAVTGGIYALFNKTRQTSITNELIDIVGGAEALK